jgi:hypothetical protein
METNKDRKYYHCWVRNITNINLVINDMGCTISPYKTVDILDYLHSYLTPENVQKSIDSGDLRYFADKKMLVIRQSEPEAEKPRTLEISKASFPNKQRSILEIEEKYYKELDFDNNFLSDEDFVEKTMESAQDDHKSIIEE